MQGLKHWYCNLRLHKKIMLLNFTVSLIPILALGIFCILYSRKLLILREETHLHNILEQANSTLDHFLSLQDNIATSLAWDASIQNAVNRVYESNYEMFLANREIFDSKLPYVQAMHREIDGITLYTGTNLYPHNGTVDRLSQLEGESWYEEALTAVRPLYICDRQKQQMLLVFPLQSSWYPNVFVIRLSYHAVFQDYCSLFEDNYAIGIYDQHGNLMFSYSQLDEAYSAYQLFPDLLEKGSCAFDEDLFFSESTQNNIYGWTIRICRPQKKLTASANSFIWIVLVIISTCIVAVAYISTRLGHQIVDPLTHLTQILDQMQADHLVVDIQSNSNDEIAHLIRSFDQMAHRLEDTIRELYVNKLAKQEYRLQMLQAQINPHFLYNCLSMINAKALRCEQPEISRIALLLSTFYRTTLNKGHSVTTVYEEWRNVTAYIELEQILHPAFRIDCRIEEQLFPYQIINLIIQPLVENAIIHGISQKDYGDGESGKISIEGKKENDRMKFTVTDNGNGMSPETLARIMTAKSSGYGIRNVEQRIRLYFGEPYGITYQSAPGTGTIAEIILPLINNLP